MRLTLLVSILVKIEIPSFDYQRRSHNLCKHWLAIHAEQHHAYFMLQELLCDIALVGGYPAILPLLNRTRACPMSLNCRKL